MSCDTHTTHSPPGPFSAIVAYGISVLFPLVEVLTLLDLRHPRDAQRAYSRQAMLCESALQSFRLYHLLEVWCRSRLPSAEQSAQDRFKTALYQPL